MVTLDDSGESGAESVFWMLVSPNNRRLGRAAQRFPAFEVCHEKVMLLRRRHADLRPVPTTTQPHGNWAWRVELDGAVAAVSTRTYLRQQECDYNLRRFLEAVPGAEVATVARTVRIGRMPATHKR
jgi:hypothetical protein